MIEVSIIVPTYNRATILRKTLLSILKQTYKNYEIIIVSNGSSDNTEEIIKSFQDQRLVYIYQKGSGSPASPRNTGIKIAKGNFIAFCDDDDIWLPTKLEKQISFLHSHPQFDVCYTKMKRFNESIEWINPDDETKNQIDSKQLLIRNTMPLSSVVIRKNKLIESGFFDENKKIAGAEDYELFLRLSKKYMMYCIDEYLLLYYSGVNRFSNTTAKNSLLIRYKYIARLYNVYLVLIRKKIFKFSEIITPFLFNIFFVIKIVIYDLLVKKSDKNAKNNQRR